MSTIEEIHKSLLTLKESLPSFRQYLNDTYKNRMDEGIWGEELEYSPKGLLKELVHIIVDTTSLVQNQDYFIRLSTYNERENVRANLSNIIHFSSSLQIDHLIFNLNNLKILLRPYNLRSDKKRMIAFQNVLDEQIGRSEELKHLEAAIKEQESKINHIVSEVLAQYDDISQKQKKIVELLENSQAINKALNAIKEDSHKIEKEIRSAQSVILNSEEKCNEKVESIAAIIKEVNQHEQQIKQQNERFEIFNQTLAENETQQKKYLEEALNLIEKAKTALSYTTSVGLGASFDTQYKNLTGKFGYKLWIWIVAAVVTIIGVVCIGIWLINGNHQVQSDSYMWTRIVGKLSMIPLLVTATLFCAKQYTKQKNLLEDYAYKRSLAQSMIAFSEELREKDAEKYREYLSMALTQIHQDPLRHRVNPNAKVEAKSNYLINESILNYIKQILALVQKKDEE